MGGDKHSKKKLIIAVALILIAAFVISFTIAGCRRILIRKISQKQAEVSEQSEGTEEAAEDISNDNESENNESESSPGNSEEESIAAENEQSNSNDQDSEQGSSESQPNNEAESEEQNNNNENANNEESAENEEAEEFTLNMPLVASECGNIIGDTAYSDPVIYPGDNGEENLEVRGFISYDISDLTGATIIKANLKANADNIFGKPFVTYGPLIIKAVYWGARPITPADYNLDGVELANFRNKNFGIGNSILKNDLQNAASSGSGRYQICFYFEMDGTDGDNEADNITYYLDQITLSVTYTK